MLDQPIDALAAQDLQRLVENRVSEGRSLDFKRELPGGRDADRKEFLADVTAFANAHGGDLVFGVDEVRGAATAIPGVQADDPEALILRLDAMLRDGVAPRMIGVRMRWVPLANGGGVLVIRIPASLTAPHRVTFQNNGKFYTRNSAGKYEMDVHDLRHAFTESGDLPRRFRLLHVQAIERAKGTDMPFAVSDKPTAVVSVMPLALFREETEIPITRDHALVPIEPHAYSSLEMIEGVLLHTPVEEATHSVRSFALTYRSGRTDVAWTIGDRRRQQNGQEADLIWPGSFERGLLDATHSTEGRLRQFGIEGPWVVMASVFRVAGRIMILGDGFPTNPAYKDQALLGELRLERLNEEEMLPIAKNFWLLFGEHRPVGRAMNER
jgi:hypothetical protein